MEPTLAGFLSFIRNVMAIDPLYLPDNSPSISWAFSIATMFVNPDLAVVGSALNAAPETNAYVQATYFLAGSNLLNFAPDQSGRTYFADIRSTLKINNFAAGVVQTASDNGTSDTLAVPESLKNLTLQNLQNLKDPYGRQYLMYAQAAGTLWGVN